MRNTNVTLQHIAADATREGTAMKHHPPHSSIAPGNSQRRRGFPLQPGLWLAALFLFVFSPFVAHAQQATGDITGRVLNQATGRYLANAVVSVDGTTIRALTDDLGVYRITSLASGTYTVRAAYIDLDSAASTVTVAAGETATADFNLTSEVYVMEAFTVSGEREGAAKALQDQRFSNNMRNIVASDSFGNMLDGNIGELMKKLPGVAIDYSGEDPGTMRIRGMPPAMASVTLDGNPIASGGGGTSRAFDLATFAVPNIDVIELNMAPTPADPSHNMGGAINFKTRNAFAQKGRRVRIDGNLSLNTTALDFRETPGGERTPDRKLKPGFMLSYSEAFGSARPFGVSIVANFYQKYRYNNNYTLPGGYQFDPNALAANGNIATADMQGRVSGVRWEESGAATERRNLSVNLDWKASDNTVLFLRAGYTNDINIGKYLHRFALNVTDNQYYDGSPLGASNFDNLIARASTATVTNSIQNGDTKLWNLNAGAEHKLGRVKIEYDAYVSQSKSDIDPSKYYEIEYIQRGINFAVLDISGNASGVIHQLDSNGVDLPSDQWSYLDVSKYNRLYMTQNYSNGTDDQMGAKFNVTVPVNISNRAGTFRFPLEIKFGGSINQQKRDSIPYYRQLRLSGDKGTSDADVASAPTLKQFVDPVYGNAWGGTFDTPIPQWLSPHQVYDYYLANPDQFWRYDIKVDNQGRDLMASEYGRTMENIRNSSERVIAGYVMATANIDKLTVMAGVRYEATHLMGEGNVHDQVDNPFGSGRPHDAYNEFLLDENGQRTIPNPLYKWDDPAHPNYNPYELAGMLYTWTKRTKDYTGVFPNIQIKYDITPNLSARAAWTTGMARPNLNDVVFGTDRYTAAYKLIRRPNPELKAQTHDLYQVRLEYYFKKFGSATLTGFYQPYKNYVQNVSFYEPYFNAEANGGEGELQMWEVAMNRNVGEGRNYGFEVSYQQRLGFIADWLQRVEFYAMFSWADPKAKYPYRGSSLGNSFTEEEAEAFNNRPTEWRDIPLNNIKRHYAAASLSYKGSKFFASLTANWTDEYAQTINTTNFSETRYAENIRTDLSLSYQLSRHWQMYFDWRNFTDVPDERSIFARTGGFYTSGMVMNLGIRADF